MRVWEFGAMTAAGVLTPLTQSDSASAQQPAAASEAVKIPRLDGPALVRELGLIESPRPVRDLIPGWTRPRKILVSVDDNPERLAWWQEAAPGVTLLPARTVEEAVKLAPQADAMVGFGNLCTSAVLKAARQVKWAHFNKAGLQDCIGDAELQSGRMMVSNMQRVFGNEIANTVMAYALALSRGLDGAMRYQLQGKWGRNVAPPERLFEIQGRTMLVVGLGGIGTNVAKYAHAMGMKVIGTRNSSREKPDFVDYVGLSDELPGLIGQADIVVNATPLTPQTMRLFNKAMFARMKKSALFISVGRGQSTVTQDLIDALKDGTIAGAGLDVTDPEPLPDGHPLFFAPNVIITPHMATAGAGQQGPEAWAVLRENLRRYVAGEKILNVVNIKAGY